MPSELTKSVRAALSSFVSSLEADGGYIAADIFRAVRDEASNVLERQMICDTFDSDPFKLCEDDVSIAKQIRRAKALINVISCSRSMNREGYSSINAVVSLGKDTLMNDVKDSLRLTFSYERVPLSHRDGDEDFGTNATEETDSDDSQSAKPKRGFLTQNHQEGVQLQETKSMMEGKMEENCAMPQSQKGTHVTYTIDLSRDHGMKERALTVEVIAAGEGPSVEEAIPMDDPTGDVWEDFDDEGNKEEFSVEGMEEDVVTEEKPPQGSAQDTTRKLATAGGDRFGAYVDPEVLMKFLDWAKLEFDESSSIFFLLTFPFYEHEWDLVGFVLDAVFGGEDGSISSETSDEVKNQ